LTTNHLPWQEFESTDRFSPEFDFWTSLELAINECSGIELNRLAFTPTLASGLKDSRSVSKGMDNVGTWKPVKRMLGERFRWGKVPVSTHWTSNKLISYWLCAPQCMTVSALIYISKILTCLVFVEKDHFSTIRSRFWSSWIIWENR
jgi:hypothetical protein